MVSSLFALHFQEHGSDAVAGDSDTCVRDYVGGPENALLPVVAEYVFARSRRFNPVLLSGPTGVGKSHLLRGLAFAYRARYPADPTLLLTGSDYARSISTALELDSLADLRQQHRGCALFVLDDLQELVDKPHAQQELQHTLDVLLREEALVLLGSRLSLAQLHFPAGLASRLAGGLTVPVRLPRREARAELVRRLAREFELACSEEAVEALATSNGRTSPRTVSELRSLVIHIRQTAGQRPTLDRQSMDDFLNQRENASPLSAARIIRKAARHFGLKAADLTGPSRRQTTVLARGVAIYLIRKTMALSFTRIGASLGGRDHTTVLHAFRRIDQSCGEPTVRDAIQNICQQLGTPPP